MTFKKDESPNRIKSRMQTRRDRKMICSTGKQVMQYIGN